jgi:hypothetical protein
MSKIHTPPPLCPIFAFQEKKEMKKEKTNYRSSVSNSVSTSTANQNQGMGIYVSERNQWESAVQIQAILATYNNNNNNNR